MKKLILYLSFFILIFLFFLIYWALSKFGDIELSGIVFHMHMLNNSPKDWMIGIHLPILYSLLCLLLFIFIDWLFPKIKIGNYIIFFVFILGWDIYFLNKHYSIFDYIAEKYHSSNFIEQNYVDPQKVKITFPKKKKNLIFIEVESLESSVQDRKNGGLLQNNYIPDLSILAKENLSFSHSKKIEGAVVLPETGWTIAGLTAETAGIPMKLYKKDDIIGNTLGEYNYFLPGAFSLGEILEENGYTNTFILGSSKDECGQGKYFTQHGNYTIYDKEAIEKEENRKIPSRQFWGCMADRELYEFAKKKIGEISKNNQPFHVLLQTGDAHMDGYLDKKCPKKYLNNLENVYNCVSLQLYDFISWLQNQDFYKDSVIVVLGDHCNMSTNMFAEKFNRNKGSIKRKIYNLFINSDEKPFQEKNRKFSTMDFFPTMLASIGAKIEGNRLGLGTNLFSKEKTLAEIYGYNHLFQELTKKSDYYNDNILYPQKNKSCISTKNCKEKFWLHAVNSPEKLKQIGYKYSGLEMDIIYHSNENDFENSHDPESLEQHNLSKTLDMYKKMGNKQSLWFDFKNLTQENKIAAEKRLEEILKNYSINKNDVWVESNNYDALEHFTIMGWKTSYYFPYYDFATMSNSEIEKIKKLTEEISFSKKVSAVSFSSKYYSFIKTLNLNKSILLLTWSDSEPLEKFRANPENLSLLQDPFIKVILVKENFSNGIIKSYLLKLKNFWELFINAL